MRCSGFSLRWLLWGSMVSRREGSVVAARELSGCDSWALEHWHDDYGAQASLLRGMWDLPGSGIEPMSPALAGRFFATEPPGKPWIPFSVEILCGRPISKVGKSRTALDRVEFKDPQLILVSL